MRTRVWALLITSVAAIGVTGALQGGPAPTLSPIRTGDDHLAQHAQPYLGGVHDRVSICVWHDGATTTAGFGADERTRYEIGSLTKTFTGVLFAAAIARGEVEVDDPLEEYLDLEGAPIASVALGELVAHTSGLGEWGDDERDKTVARWWTEGVRGGTVHNLSTEELLDRARTDPLTTRGQYRYSNIGFAVLGHALAEAAGIPYRELIQERLFNPMGLSDSGIATDSDRNPQRGFRADGRSAPPWRLGAYAPSGGGYSTAADLCAYAGALLGLHDTADDETSVDVWGTIASGTELGWTSSVTLDGLTVWKTGQTGGFSSAVAIDAPASRAVIVLSNSVNDLEPLVNALLQVSL